MSRPAHLDNYLQASPEELAFWQNFYLQTSWLGTDDYPPGLELLHRFRPQDIAQATYAALEFFQGPGRPLNEAWFESWMLTDTFWTMPVPFFWSFGAIPVFQATEEWSAYPLRDRYRPPRSYWTGAPRRRRNLP